MLSNKFFVYASHSSDSSSGTGQSIVSALTSDVQSAYCRSEQSGDDSPPVTLFGRQRQIEVLEGALERIIVNKSASAAPSIAAITAPELLLIQGKSGTGKTVLAESLRRTAAQRGAYFARGKFDQFLWQNVPYSALVDCLTDLIDIVLESDDLVMEERRAALRSCLGDDVFMLTPLLYNLDQLAGLCGYGPQSQSGIEHAFDRVKTAFAALVRSLATSEHPVVLVFDDMQWCDSASLQIIKTILSDPGMEHVLVICTCRSDADFEGVEELMSESRVVQVTLDDLKPDDAYFVTASHLQEDSLSISTLSEIAFSKTHGNPYYLQQFLALLQKKDVLTSQLTQGFSRWSWDNDRVREEAVYAGNVLEVIEAAMQQKLHNMVLHMLQICACLGHSFDVYLLELIFDATKNQKSPTESIHEILKVAAGLGHTFSRMTTELIFGAVEHQQSNELQTIDEESSESSPSNEVGVYVPNLPSIQVAVCLACATKMGFLRRDGEGQFQFTHDCVQQSVSESLGDARDDMHLAIGRLLRQHDKFNPGNPTFFFLVVDQLNAGSARIESEDAVVSLISLNVEAAVVASEQSAFMSAQRYLRQALNLLPHSTMWEEEYELMLECCSVAASIELACGNFGEANKYADQVLAYAMSSHDRIQVAFTKTSSLIATGHMEEARALTLKSLQDLGRNITPKPKKAFIAAELAKIKAMLSTLTDSQLIDMEPMTVASHKTESKLLRLLCWSSFCLGDGEMLAVAAIRIVKLTFLHGFSNDTPFAFAICGLVHSSVKNHIEATRYGHLGLQTLERVKDAHIKSRTLLVLWSFVMHWSTKLTNIHQGIARAYEFAKASGDSDLAFSCALNTCSCSFLQGREHLEVVKGYIRSICDEMTHHEYKDADLNIYRIMLQAATNLSGHTYFPCKLTGEVMAEEIMLQQAAEHNTPLTQYAVSNVKLQICVFFDQWEMAEDIVDRLGDNYKSLQPHHSHIFFWMFATLTHIIRFNETKKRKYKKVMKISMKEFKSVVDEGVEACVPMFALLLAEESAAGGKKQTMLDAFDYAARCFGTDGYINFQALSYERASRNLIKFYPADAINAKDYLLKARARYVRWGAHRKVASLDEEMFRKWQTTLDPSLERSTSAATLATSEDQCSIKMEAKINAFSM